MSKTLVIAEKPSVAADIAKALGKFEKHNNDFFENDQYVISSAVGGGPQITPAMLIVDCELPSKMPFTAVTVMV